MQHREARDDAIIATLREYQGTGCAGSKRWGVAALLLQIPALGAATPARRNGSCRPSLFFSCRKQRIRRRREPGAGAGAPGIQAEAARSTPVRYRRVRLESANMLTLWQWLDNGDARAFSGNDGKSHRWLATSRQELPARRDGLARRNQFQRFLQA